MELTVNSSVSSKTKVSLLATGHLVNDLYAAFLDTFLPTMVRNLGFSYVQAGILTSLSGIMHVVFQPIMGHVADGHTRPWPIMFGPIATALGASLIPLSSSYTMALSMVVLWGLGTASFHPQGQGSLGYITPPQDLAFAISLFGLGGMSGVTVSSLYAVALYRFLPHWVIPLVAVTPPILLACVYYRIMPQIRESSDEHINTAEDGFIKNLVGVFRLVYPIWIVTFLRDCSKRGLRFLIPLLVTAHGGSMTQVGTLLFALSLNSAIAPLIVARIALKVGNVPVVRAIIPSAGTLLCVAWLVDSSWSIPLFVIGGALLSSCSPATDAMAQNLASKRRSTASSIMMGFSFGLGGAAMAPLGWFSDQTGLRAALGLVSFLPFLAVPTMMFLWPKKGIA